MWTTSQCHYDVKITTNTSRHTTSTSRWNNVATNTTSDDVIFNLFSTLQKWHCAHGVMECCFTSPVIFVQTRVFNSSLVYLQYLNITIKLAVFFIRNNWPKPILSIRLIFCVLYPQILLNYLAFQSVSVQDESYIRNASCATNLLSTFLFQKFCTHWSFICTKSSIKI